MSEPTKALLIVLGIIVVPLICYAGYLFLKDYFEMKNAIEVDFKNHKGKTTGYIKDKKGKWQPVDDLYLEEDHGREGLIKGHAPACSLAQRQWTPCAARSHDRIP